jgi:hypothetical protein
MSDLEQVPASAVARDGVQQVVVAILLQVAGEQGPLLTDAHGQHDGGVVDGAAG